ncbi:MAG: hypothetical protein ACXQTZ_03335, partial [Candidatus Alkanophagales archaeon]
AGFPRRRLSNPDTAVLSGGSQLETLSPQLWGDGISCSNACRLKDSELKLRRHETPVRPPGWACPSRRAEPFAAHAGRLREVENKKGRRCEVRNRRRHVVSESEYKATSGAWRLA